MASPRDYQQVPKEEEQRLTSSEYESDDGPSNISLRKRSDIDRLKVPALWTSGCFFLMAATGLYALLAPVSCSARDVISYTPAADAIKYHTVIYPDAMEHKTDFMGDPSPELDAIWEADYDLISGISKSQNENLLNKADEQPNDPGHYPVMLDIFHSIHCLNELRMTLSPDYYGEPHVRQNTTKERIKRHNEHCLEHIRMALWCNADLSPIPFQKNDHGGLTASHEYTHTCRDKEAILKWAKANQIRKAFE